MRSLCLFTLSATLAWCIGCQAPLRATGQADGARPRGPQAGEKGPLFTLKTLDGKTEVNLAKYAGDRPVLLFFGSYT